MVMLDVWRDDEVLAKRPKQPTPKRACLAERSSAARLHEAVNDVPAFAVET